MSSMRLCLSTDALCTLRWCYFGGFALLQRNDSQTSRFIGWRAMHSRFIGWRAQLCTACGSHASIQISALVAG